MGDLILTEVMQGVTTQREFTHLKRHFEHFPVYTMVGRQIALQSAVNYRKLRAQGITVRKTIDCWIATFCIQRGFLLLHSDRDFDPFEKHLGLRTPS
jgi:predicted nucleic acid-binding protein